MSVLREAIIGALLTGLMMLLFLRDWRSSLIVVITIPFALLSAVVLLELTGQTINIMTLGGLPLAVGVLVDEGTVLLENIHVHLDARRTRRRGLSSRKQRSRNCLDCSPCLPCWPCSCPRSS